MKEHLSDKIEACRLTKDEDEIYGSDKSYGMNGMFHISYCGKMLRVIVSDQLGWDHVSVSKQFNITPSWDDMCFIKDTFFKKDELALQFHPPKSVYINIHKGCLHLWRNQSEEPQLPPWEMV